LKYLSLDIGEKRIGVAVTDDAGIISRPLMILHTEDNFMERLGEILDVEKPGMIIFGIPRHQNGAEGEMGGQIRELAKGIKHEYNIEVDFEDESGTSVIAEERLREAGKRGEEIKEALDAEAAAIILESYLATKKRS
jgi:putative Holliday junction resolvase